jgi:single-stranded-DNA-specific exonuclease
LLLAQSIAEAAPLAEVLDTQNRERQRLTEEMVAAARQMTRQDDHQQALYFISDPGFNAGVVGLAASRLTEEFYRPSLVAEQGPVHTKGAARSIPEFHITEALDQCADLLLRYGGHAAAAGFTLKNEDVPVFMARLQEFAAERLKDADLRPTLNVDGEVNLRGVRPALVEELHSLQPFGYGNPPPCFVSKNLRVKSKQLVGREGNHLKLLLSDGQQDWSAIAFKLGDWAARLQPMQPIDIVYNLEFNEWNGTRTVQLNIKDLHPSDLTGFQTS